ncbi:MAG: copper chaperone [Gemmatimonadetes bacterium]|nr:copper chaperone [Gemmatimonadota bacterium]
MTTKTVKVPSISCGHCVATIEREVGGLDGVASVKADRATRDVTIAWDPKATDWTAIDSLMREINYAPAD